MTRTEGSGIPKGYKYEKLSPQQKRQRKGAVKAMTQAHVEGGRFSLAKIELGKCKLCPIRDICDDYIEKKNIVQRGGVKVRGCNQMRELYTYNIKTLSTSEAHLVSRIAKLQAKLDMQEAKDGFENAVFSPEWIKGMQLFNKSLELLHKLRERRGNRANPIPVEAEVIEFNDEKEDKEHLGKGDMYIPPPKPKEKPKVLTPKEVDKYVGEKAEREEEVKEIERHKENRQDTEPIKEEVEESSRPEIQPTTN